MPPSEILPLAQQLIRIPSVTVGEETRLEEVRRAVYFAADYLRSHRLEVRLFDQGDYPALLAGFPGQLLAPVMLNGHLDVVAAEPGIDHFQPRIEGDYLWGRGAADMKTVVATYLVWMKNTRQTGPPYPSINLLLIGNEETGEEQPTGTSHALAALEREHGYAPQLLIAGERTEETGSQLWGQVCVENRGVARFQVIARGQRGHSGSASLQNDLTQRIIRARQKLSQLAARHLTLESADGWHSQIRFPFAHIGTPGVYNIVPDYGVLGVEIRPIPADDVTALVQEFQDFCRAEQLEIDDLLVEPGVVCDPGNPYLRLLLDAVRQASGRPPELGRKLHGTSARFAPGGNGVVWGQSGLGPHARDERHYIPSIEPYYRALDALGAMVK